MESIRVYVWDGLQQLAADNPIPPDIRARMDADRAKAEMSNVKVSDPRRA